MKRILSLLLALTFVFALAGCRNETDTTLDDTQASPTGSAPSETANDAAEQPSDGHSALVVYFSRTGEQYRVGVIDEGNTAIVAKIIAEQTGADLYEILPAQDNYPNTYKELTDYAKREQNENARPAIRGELPDVSGYDTVFIGAPVWWGDWPMICYTFFESVDLSGKTLVPFSTHEGSGLSSFDRKLAASCPNAQVTDGLAVRGEDCQKDRVGVQTAVTDFLAGLGY